MQAQTSGPERAGATPSPGAVIGGRYRLTRVAGRGGMGTVWEATNTWTERRVAVKVMDGDGDGARGTASPDRVERFLREAKATAKVRHPHVVDVLDMGNDPEGVGLFIVYEFLDGETLRAVFERRGALPPAEALALVTPAMEGVAEAHRCGVVHRDLKPENILLARDAAGREAPRVIDFGIARTDAPDGPLTRTGEVIGTARYMAPEQCRGARDLDARVDVWAFGVILFEALAGRPPFAGDGYHETLAAVLTTDAPPLRSLRPDVPARVAAAVDRALARDRDARHPTLRAFLDALDGAPAADAPAPTATAAAAPTAAPAETAPAPGRAHASITFALLAVAALAAFALRPTASPRAPAAAPPATIVTPVRPASPPLAAATPTPAAPSSPTDTIAPTPAPASLLPAPPRAATAPPRGRRPLAPPRAAAPAASPSAPAVAAPTAPPPPLPNGAPVLEP